MSYKKTTVYSYVILIVLGIGAYYLATKIPYQADRVFAAGPIFYPQMLSGLVVLFSAIGLIMTLRKKEDRVVDFPFPKRYVAVLALLCVWTVLWEIFGRGYFYLITYVVCAGLLYYFNDAPHSVKKVGYTLAVDAIIVGIYYVLFNIIVQLRL